MLVVDIITSILFIQIPFIINIYKKCKIKSSRPIKVDPVNLNNNSDGNNIFAI